MMVSFILLKRSEESSMTCLFSLIIVILDPLIIQNYSSYAVAAAISLAAGS